MKRILKWGGGIILVLAIIVLVRTFIPSQTGAMGVVYDYQADRDKVAALMSKAVQYQTISFGRDKPVSANALLDFHAFLEQSFPFVHENLTREIINDYSLLYRWQGSGSNEKPVLMLGHMDVVPISPGTQQDWQHDPFAGDIADGYVWGRGTMDDKINIIGLLQAAEDMLAAGIQPKRDIYFAFGHDEEQGGLDGAYEIARVLEARGLEFEFLVDEGGVVARNVIPDVEDAVAIIAPAEKGIVTLKLTAYGQGGHSSMPAPQSSIGILAAAIVKLEQDQFPRDFAHVRDFFTSFADELPFGQKLIMKNLWLFKPLVMRMFQHDPSMQALMRTTTAVTVINGGIKNNVLPISAYAKVNFRILPGETPDTVMARVIEVVDDDRIEVAFENSGQVGMAPSPVTPTQGFGWEHLTGAIRDTIAPERVIIAPRLLVAATDTRHYRKVTPNHYRFSWLVVDATDLGRIHGTNERIGIDHLANGVRFYHRFLSQL